MLCYACFWFDRVAGDRSLRVKLSPAATLTPLCGFERARAWIGPLALEPTMIGVVFETNRTCDYLGQTFVWRGCDLRLR